MNIKLQPFYTSLLALPASTPPTTARAPLPPAPSRLAAWLDKRPEDESLRLALRDCGVALPWTVARTAAGSAENPTDKAAAVADVLMRAGCPPSQARTAAWVFAFHFVLTRTVHGAPRTADMLRKAAMRGWPKAMRELAERLRARLADPLNVARRFAALAELASTSLTRRMASAKSKHDGSVQRAAVLDAAMQMARAAGTYTAGQRETLPKALESRSLTVEEWRAMLAQGQLFFDPSGEGTVHGIDTHVLQLTLFADDIIEACKPLGIGSVPEFLRYLAAEPCGTDFFAHLLDAFGGDATSPQTLQALLNLLVDPSHGPWAARRKVEVQAHQAALMGHRLAT